MTHDGVQWPLTCSDFFTKLLQNLIFLLLFSAQCQGETAGTKGRLDHSVLVQLGADETLQMPMQPL